jgi:cation diffusion facilitator family transporter
MAMNITERPVGPLRRAAVMALTLGVVIFLAKLSAYLLTGSTAILSDAAESIINIVTAAFAIYSLHVAIKPADEGHPYGHRKIEFFATALEGGAITLAAFWIIYKAVHEIIDGPDLNQLDIGVILVALSATVNGLLGWYLIRFGKKERSLILEADGRHVLTDVYTSAGVVVGLIMVLVTKWQMLDPIIAIIAALNIIRTGWQLLRRATGGMMDAVCTEDKAIITEILSRPQFSEICSHHKLRCRHSGNFHFVDFHLMFPRDITVAQAHAIATAIEAQVASELGDASVMAHIEPCKDPSCKRCVDGRNL